MGSLLQVFFVVVVVVVVVGGGGGGGGGIGDGPLSSIQTLLFDTLKHRYR